MIAFETRKEDLLEQNTILEILSSILVLYERTQDVALEPHVLFWKEELDNIQMQLKGDYTEREKRYKVITKHLDKAFNRIRESVIKVT